MLGWTVNCFRLEPARRRDEVDEQIGAYERAGCDRVMLQHLLHADLEPVRLIGRELASAVA